MFHVSGPVEAVFGYADSDKYYQNDLFQYGDSEVDKQYFMFHRVVSEPAVIRAWEFSIFEAGSFHFMVRFFIFCILYTYNITYI